MCIRAQVIAPFYLAAGLSKLRYAGYRRQLSGSWLVQDGVLGAHLVYLRASLPTLHELSLHTRGILVLMGTGNTALEFAIPLLLLLTRPRSRLALGARLLLVALAVPFHVTILVMVGPNFSRHAILVLMAAADPLGLVARAASRTSSPTPRAALTATRLGSPLPPHLPPPPPLPPTTPLDVVRGLVATAMLAGWLGIQIASDALHLLGNLPFSAKFDPYWPLTEASMFARPRADSTAFLPAGVIGACLLALILGRIAGGAHSHTAGPEASSPVRASPEADDEGLSDDGPAGLQGRPGLLVLIDDVRLILVRVLCAVAIGGCSALDVLLRIGRGAGALAAKAVRHVRPAPLAPHLDDSRSRRRPHVVIIGGSFAGLAAQRALCDASDDLDVTLIDAADVFEYTPGLLRCYVDPSHLRELCTPMPRSRNDFVHATAVAVDLERAIVKVRGSGTSARRGAASAEYAYDFLLIASGVTYPCAPIRPPIEPPVARSTVTAEGDTAPWDDDDDESGRAEGGGAPGVSVAGHFARRQRSWDAAAASLAHARVAIVVGGGPVGVELAAEMASASPYVQVHLLTAGGALCASLPPAVGRIASEWLDARGVRLHFYARVEEMARVGGGVMLSGGEVIGGSDVAAGGDATTGADAAANTTLIYDCRGSGRTPAAWLAASLPPTAFEARSGRVRVTETLQLAESLAGGERAYAIGDAASRGSSSSSSSSDGATSSADPQLAHAAELHAHLAAKNILRQAKGEREKPALLRYPHDAVGSDLAPQIYAISLGESDAIVAFNGYVLSGALPAVAKRLLEWSKVAACAERPVGVLIWAVAEAATNAISRDLLPPPPPPPIDEQKTRVDDALLAGPIGPQHVRTRSGGILLFDGDCLLCDGFVQFVIDHDHPPPFSSAGSAAAESAAAAGRPSFRFSFATLQSEVGRSYLAAAGLPIDVSTVVLVDELGAHTRSTAALRTLTHCGAPYSSLAQLLTALVPRPLRDLGYKTVAAVRYRVFGKDDGATCRRMTKALRARFQVPAWQPR